MARGDRGRQLRRLRQRPDHHALRGAAADRHAGDAGALSRPRRGHQPGALGARLSRLVLRAGAGRGARRPDAALDPRLRPPSSPRSSSAYTRWGRTTYAIGSNETAARFSGLSVERTKLAIYTASGFAAAVAAVIFVSRVSTTRSDMGTGIELDAITAVVLGGTSIFGGRGTIVGTVLGLCPDPGAEERPVARRRQGRRHDRADRRRADPGDPAQQPLREERHSITWEKRPVTAAHQCPDDHIGG